MECLIVRVEREEVPHQHLTYYLLWQNRILLAIVMLTLNSYFSIYFKARINNCIHIKLCDALIVLLLINFVILTNILVKALIPPHPTPLSFLAELVWDHIMHE